MRQPRDKRLLLASIGLILNSSVLVASHYLQIPDFLRGVLMGIGIGLILMAAILMKKKAKAAR